MSFKFLVLGLLASVSAFADHYSSAGPYQCKTYSNGYEFLESSYDYQTGLSRVRADCRSRAFTSNYECDQNAFCRDQFGKVVQGPMSVPSAPLYKCTSYSRGQKFVMTSANEAIARQEVVNRCMLTPYTVNAECILQTSCVLEITSGYPAPVQPPYVSPYPRNNGGPQFCYDSCRVGALCTDGCPYGATQCHTLPNGLVRVLGCY